MYRCILEQMGEEKIGREFWGYSPAVACLVDLDLPLELVYQLSRPQCK